jgi:uncharacterized protein YdeI (YjbR/CyaY-like superfamily)
VVVTKSKARTFQARLETGGQTLGWTTVRVPFAPGEAWKDMIRLRVRGTLNGFAFRTSLFPDSRAGDGAGDFFLLVNKAMQRGGEARLGDVGEFTLEPDLDARDAELPDELLILLDDEPGLHDWYNDLSEYTRREIGKWIVGVKSDASKMKRAEQTAERLLATMDAERELPPMIVAAFNRRPKAKTGWAKMTRAQRRNELLAVFHYQTLPAIQKRLEKLCDLAEKRI